MGSRLVGEWCNRSSMHGVAWDRMGLRSMRLVARGRRKPISFWRATAGTGDQLREQGRDCVEGVHIPSLAAVAEPRYRAVLTVFACCVADTGLAGRAERTRSSPNGPPRAPRPVSLFRDFHESS